MLLKTLLLPFFCFNICFAQNKLPTDIAFRRLTTAHGLAQDEVHDIQQDEQGFMWFTTTNGLCRYDGKNVTKWAIADTATLDIINKGILVTHCIDNAGNFWIGTDHQGIFYYNKQQRKFERFLHNKNNEPTQYFIYKMICTNNNKIFAATSKGLWEYDIKAKKAVILFENKRIKNVKIQNDDLQQPYISICTEKNGIWRYKNKTWSLIHGTAQYENINDAYFTPNLLTTLWIATDKGLIIQKNNIFNTILHFKINSFLLDNKNRMWVNTEKGLYTYNNTNVNIYTHNPILKSSISTDHIICSTTDRQGNIWLGTYTGGINWFSLDNQPITNLSLNSKISFKTPTDYIFSKNDITNIKTKEKWVLKTNIKEKKMYNFVHFRDSNNNFWWSIDDNGLGFYNIKAQKTAFYTSDMTKPTTLQNNVITAIFEDNLKNVWITTFGGLHLYEPSTNTFKHLRSIITNYDETANSTIAHYIDTRGYMWLGKWEGGLEVFDPITKKYQHFDTNDGLPNNCITGIQQDSSGNIWIATLNGIAKINPVTIFSTQKTPIKVYSERDGLPTNRLEKIKYIAASKTEDEQLYFKTDDGIAVLYPKRLNENEYAPQAAITDLKINGENFATKTPINELNGIDLLHHQNNLTIEMAALSYIQPERNQFEYRLIGFDSTWIKNGNDNVAKYTNLTPGTYIFEYKPINNDGKIGKKYTFTIDIKPALWQRAEFKGFIILLIIGVSWWIIRQRIKQIQQREMLARQLSESELAMLRAQMNPHFIFNCMNTIEAYIMMEQPEKASEYTRKFSKLTRAVLENSEKSLIPLETDIEILKIYIELEQIRYRNRFQVIFDIPDAVLDAEPNIPPMLLQPLVENAILHGLQHRVAEGGILKISACITNSRLECSVEDNGIGRKAAAAINAHKNQQKQSLATSITHKRLALLQQQNNAPTSFMLVDLPQGTRAVVQLPLL